MRSWHVRAYAGLLRVYPRRFRAEYRHEMTILFAQQLSDVRASEGVRGVVRLWLHTFVDLAATAPSEHLEKEALVPETLGHVEGPRAGRDRVSATNWTLVALLPVWTVLALRLAAPNFIDAILLNPPAILGLPAGVVGLAASFAWAGIGVALVRRASSPALRIVIFVLFAVPATLAVLMLPAFILIVLNLST